MIQRIMIADYNQLLNTPIENKDLSSFSPKDASADKIYHLTSDMEAKGFRMYFEDVAGQQSARELTWSVDENPSETNDISSVPNSSSATIGDVYSINGQQMIGARLDGSRISVESLPKGVYVFKAGGKSIKFAK